MSPRLAAVLLALVPAVGVAVAAPATRPDPKEQAAAEALKKAGFKLEVAKGGPRARVTGAVWNQTDRAADLTAAVLDRLRELPHLASLRVVPVGERFALRDEAAGHLAGLRGLANLRLYGVDFRPGTLARIAGGLPDLTVLDIGFSRFSGKELDAAGKLPKLRDLDLSGTPVTDADLGLLGKSGAFLGLKHLSLLACAKVMPGGVAALRKACPKLRIDFEPTPSDPGAAQ